MEILSKDTKFAHLGKPGTTFSKGFQRRLDLINQKVDFKDKKILDQGCGEGVWLAAFARYTPKDRIFGFDIDKDLVEKLQKQLEKPNSKNQIPKENIKVSAAENLDFPDNFFDIVFSNEVLEHVVDDKKAVEEVLRVLRPGGKFIIFTPNRGWPFETHGMFLKGKYYWGNIPLLPWMPSVLRKKFAPHVRNYSNSEIKSLIENAEFRIQNIGKSKIQNSIFKILYSTHVFPGFDGLERRFGIVGKLIKNVFHLLEKTPLRFFGISHFIIAEKV